MQLTSFSDYSLRLLLYLGTHSQGSVAEVAEFYNISRDHLGKVAHNLTRMGLIEATRGRGGGISLAKGPAEINIGQVVRQTEHFNIVECFDPEQNTCRLSPACRLKGVLHEATRSFIESLDRYTLADLIPSRPSPTP
jgi:Rrf2 family nitric oxide-sensitive transcriptional repressor